MQFILRFFNGVLAIISPEAAADGIFIPSCTEER